MQNQTPKALNKSWLYNLRGNDGDVVGQKVCRREEREDWPTPTFTQVVIKGGVVA